MGEADERMLIRRRTRIFLLLAVAIAVAGVIIWRYGLPTSSENRLLLLLLAMILAGVEPVVCAWDNRRQSGKGEYLLDAGIALTDLAPEGTVKIRGEIWKARSHDERRISAGSKVTTVGRAGLTLIVKAAPPNAA